MYLYLNFCQIYELKKIKFKQRLINIKMILFKRQRIYLTLCFVLLSNLLKDVPSHSCETLHVHKHFLIFIVY